MLRRYLMARNVSVCAAFGSKDHYRTPAGSGRNLFVDLGAGGNKTGHHRIAFRNIVTDLFVPGECATDKGDSGVRNVEQIAPYPVLSQDERRNIYLLPLLRIIGKIVGQKQGGGNPFIEGQWRAGNPCARRSLVEKQV